MDATRSPAQPEAPWVMLLSVWPGTDAASTAGWHARIVLPDARTREFASPFELAQFVGRALRHPSDPGQGSGGLR
jgi:hypothetical protein